MGRIDKTDKNFEVATAVDRTDLEWHPVTEEGFAIYGLYAPLIYGGKAPSFRRLPDQVAASVSDGVKELNPNPAGGRLRFTSDSEYIAIRCTSKPQFAPHMPLTGSSGFDLYLTENGETRFEYEFVPPFEFEKDGTTITYESGYSFGSANSRDLTLNFPLYTNVDKLEIGLVKGACITRSPGYSIPVPVVFYGSSITQGGCASRPGNAYQGFLSRKFDFDYINLGFSGSAKGELAMAEYIKNLKMSAFVYDYDYNALTAEHLYKTHYLFYKVIRDANKDLPILCLSRPTFKPAKEPDHRRAAVESTVSRAIAEGDHNIYFLSGEELFGTDARDCCTVDGCHPNDLGLYRMAKAMEPYMEKLLEKVLKK